MDSQTGTTPETQILAKINSLAPLATRVELSGASNHVLANVTSVESGAGLVVHLLNYDQTPAVTGMKLKLILGKDFEKLSGRSPALLSPETTSPGLQKVQWTGSTMEATLPVIDKYSVVVLR